MDKPQTSLDTIRSRTGQYLKTGIKQLKDGIIDNNPILVQLLGTCPMLAVSTSVTNAVGMGIATTSVLVFSNLLISLLRRFIPKQVRIAAFIIIISGFVSAVELIMKAYFPVLDRSLGVFIPLIVVNCIILARAEIFASKNGPIPSVMDGLSMGLGFMFGLILLASIREILGTGKLAGYLLLGENYKPALLFIMPPGAFITLGCLIALMQKMKSLKSKNKKVMAEGEQSDLKNKKVEAKAQRIAEAKLKSEFIAVVKAEVKAKAEAEKTVKKTEQDAASDHKTETPEDAVPQVQKEPEKSSEEEKSKTEISDGKEKKSIKTENGAEDVKDEGNDAGGNVQ